MSTSAPSIHIPTRPSDTLVAPSGQSFPVTTGSPHAAQLEQVHRELERMTAYARALETRCNVLRVYVPGNQGSQDPIVPFLADDLGITATTVTHVEILASHD
ncbi:MAG TPA: hypothetical protein VGR29_05035 [Thermomicrobiales bacterium]|nr:hypothetical protein [Thermomicrobiales bacterium]